MYKSLQIKIIKNSLYNDELQILSKSNDILFILKGYEYKSYELIDNFLIVNIDEGHKYTMNNIYINLDSFIIYEELFEKGNQYYGLYFHKEKKMIKFNNKLYKVKYFFDNINEIIDLYEFDRHQIDTTKDTLLMSIFRLFNKNIDNNSQINILGFTYGMSNRDIDIFKDIPRDHTKTIEKQLSDTLFDYNQNNYKVYDIELLIFYKDNNNNKQFKIRLECKDKQLIGNYMYGNFDDQAKLKII
jgi:hypothetical protein